MRRWGVAPQLVAVVPVLGLVVAMGVQPTRQLFAQRDRISEISGDLNSLERGNRALEERVQRLNDPDYLEQEARRLGLTRPGETIYVVVPPSRKDANRGGRDAPAQRQPVRPATSGFLEGLLHFVGLR
jgi:cell division protein FtsB